MINHKIDSLIKLRTLSDILTNTPSIVRVNKFTEDSAKTFAENFNSALQTGQRIIPVEIDSFGGQVYSLLAMVDIIKSSPVPVATIVTGKAMSCGAILFTCGSDGMRYMHPNSTLLIHDVSSMTLGKVEDLKVDVAEVERLNQLVYHMMAANVGKEPNYFLDIIHEKGHTDWYLTPQEALKHNLANKISCPKFDVNISVDISFG
jgi:ATP-dependent Clp protease protease subunit